MKKTILIACISCLLVATAFISYQIGLSNGFGYGYTYEATHSAPSRGLETLIALENFRLGETENAIIILETALDSSIIVHHAGTNDIKIPVPYMSVFPDSSEAETNIMKRLAKYRKENPSPSPYPDPMVRKSIENALNYYLQ